MYLSRIQLSLTERSTMKALADLKYFHEALDNCFPGERPGNMWRIDKLKENLYILVLSEEKADLSPFCRLFSPSENSWETKDYDPLLGRLRNGSIWRFRLSANPTYYAKAKDPITVRGKVRAHKTTEHQREWLIKQSQKNGFQLAADGFEITENKWLRFHKSGGNVVTILSVTYEGLLMVTDVELFRKALTNGIGRGKAYGMGLLTIMSV
ncbi:MAG: type I-E CRISPR-associated protein Cas6/Cse3/CasE [Synergistaceae bacterium]|nr:type I-E CRISPR-associated protein Cas6/Cse3/CasE [Synergistaceae bacterium]MBQ6665504.1 type I-E CRISPR-associated protein Cas6/Cse3/CasE [Synergistaceae bacterium]MBQ6983260.1 type I-E CRISPR-associated protein Cas6/Cse3/CasE [Synergistaceae bacterium]MBR0247864.1 type I-E CRISPR-associated protein Cas6/Cse3/CasE [Synergistaceae bacterium]